MAFLIRLIVLTCLLPLVAVAQDVYVPEDLQDWQEWVLHDKEYLDCPFLFDRGLTSREEYICAWPGQLDVSVDADGGQFTQQWTVYAETQWLPLPGDTSYWPHRVTANGRALEVVLRSDAPYVRLGPGRYQLAGSFEWDERPGVLRVPAQSGMIALTVNGSDVARPERTQVGLYLGERRQETQQRDAVRAEVYRLVVDGVPTQLGTQLHIEVSGSLREELFGPILPDGFVPLALSSQLPARLEPDGKLRVQVRPGRWTITLSARAPDVLNSVAMSEPEENLPVTEIWSYRSNDRLRVTAAGGLSPVDPQQVNVPAGWDRLPAFRIQAGEVFEISERSRGIVAADNELTLNREMWLNFDGSGFVMSDAIGGTMRSEWRLDMAPPYALLTASEYNENLLVTNGQGDGETGVELRSRNVDVESLASSNTRSSMPVSGWSTRFDAVSTTLHLPPGNKLLTAPGADSAPGSWVSRWRLLDFFLVLIITIAAWRLFGRTAGVIALLAMVLSFHELNAPSWLWLNLMIAIALMRVAPAGRLRRSVNMYQLVSATLLVFALVPFFASQMRIAIYPQLEPQYGGAYALTVPASEQVQFEGEMDGFADDQNLAMARKRAVQSLADSPMEEIVVTARSNVSYSRYAPNAIVQAGPGIPSWRWNTYRLAWSGPVDAEQSLRLVILPRWSVTALRFIEVLMLLLFTGVLAAELLRRRIRIPGGLVLGGTRSAGLLVAGLMFLFMGASPEAQAQTPDPALLTELEERLLKAAECVPRCAEIVAADIEVAADSVTMSLTIHALADVAVPLPGSEQGWRPVAIMLDGTAAGQVIRGPGQALWVRLAAGRHSMVLSGPVAAVDSLEISFPTPPRVIEAGSDAWFIAGIKDRRLLSGSLQLTRLQTEGSGDSTARWESSRFPTFARIERTVALDLDWNATTTVFRVAPAQGALTLEVPLLPGEIVLSEDFTVTDGRVLVSMNPNQNAVSWRTNLPRTSPLELSAAATSSWSEIWRIGVGSIWHAEFSGIPETENSNGDSGARIAEFHPRGGESLTIVATRPEASSGSSLAFDSVELSVEHGGRSSTVNLALKYRSTNGAQHTLTLPEGAEVTEVYIDGELEPLRADDRELTVPILPGEHDIEVTWRSEGEVSVRSQTPQLDVAAFASNITLNVELPANRWLIATSGPKLGPAVLYWSELLVLLLFALILGKLSLTPLKTWHWLLLGLGFSTFNWPVLGIVVVWLLACGAREKWQTDAMAWWRFNLIQIAVAALTIISLLALVASLPSGLLGSPDMQISGNYSHGNSLSWFADRSESILPVATAWSVPMFAYKALILGWALWLSFAMLRWLPWVWQCFSSQGFWRSRKTVPLRETEAT
jgi:hypothetical protein